MNIPKDLRFTKDHEWIKSEGKTAIIGITDYAQGELGDIVFMEIETQGEQLEQGEVFGTVEAVKTVSDLYMPVGGRVIEINSKLENQPELVNKDPFGEGWLIKIEIKDPSQIDKLLNSAEYEALINS